MAIQALHKNVAADAVEFSFPLLDQMRRRDNQHHLIVRDLSPQLLDDTCRQCNRGGAADQGFADPHLSDEQDAVPVPEAAHRRADHMLLRRIHRVFALQPDAIQPAPHSGKIKAVHRLELPIEVTGQRTLVGGDETQQRLIAFHLDHRAILRQQCQGRRRFEADGGFLDLPFRVAGGSFDFHTGNLLDMLRLTPNGDLPVVFGLDDRAVGNPCCQYQRHVTRTRRDDRFNLFRWARHVQQRLKAVGLPCTLLLNQPQSLFFINHIRGEDKAGDVRWRRQFVEGFGLHRQGTRAGFAVQNGLIEFRRVRMRAFDGGDHDLIVLTLMFPRQRPDIHAAAVLRQKRGGIF